CVTDAMGSGLDHW
nr:immunoglobulin heavy chain junction region [Macaca mulatta]MOV58383.1 immunoglobulin heavy chain junction region [Macaca mulatta]MOV60351.1 immunoglobulin heavy chain junction region [Macaca mulatta]MOV60785.1 immunoglobulin heavy chain junction region [Macaca mulatta]